MAWIDKKGRIGGVIHWLDLLLLLAALAVITRVVILSWPGRTGKETRLIRFEVTVSALPSKQAENIGVGQWVKDDRTGDYLGKIVRKEVAASVEYQWEDGKLFPCPIPDKKEVTLIIERRGEVNEREGIYLGRQALRAGEERVFRTLYSVFSGRIDHLAVSNE